MKLFWSLTLYFPFRSIHKRCRSVRWKTCAPLRTRDSAMEGDSTVEYLQQFKVDIALLGTLGIDPDGSLGIRRYFESPSRPGILHAIPLVVVLPHTSPFAFTPLQLIVPQKWFSLM